MANAFRPTKMGDTLAAELSEYIGWTPAIRSLCAAIVRNANRLHNLAVLDCNGAPIRELMTYGMSPERRANMEASAVATEKRGREESQRVAARVRDLVAMLPDTDGGPWRVTVNGDPRGAVVYLTAPGWPESRRIVCERGPNLR